MSIRDRIDDAHLLIENGRHESAAVMIMVAVSGSSWRRYPKKKAGNAFKTFVNDELLVSQRGGSRVPDMFLPMGLPDWKSRKSEMPEMRYDPSLGEAGIKAIADALLNAPRIPIARVLWEAYRCVVEHTGEFHERFSIISPQRNNTIKLPKSNGGNTGVVGIPFNDLYGLLIAVIAAPENSGECGDLLPKNAEALRKWMFPMEYEVTTREITEYLDARANRLAAMRTFPNP